MDLKKEISDIKVNIELIKAEGTIDAFGIEMAFLERYPDLYDKYPFLVKKLISGENMDMLEKMLSSIDNIKKGANKYKEEVKLGKELEKKYIKKE